LFATLSVAVGIRNAGPTPQIRPPAVGALGDKNRLCMALPNPNCEPSPGISPSWLTIGTIVREMTFHRESSEFGMTGWMLRYVCSPFPSAP